MLNPSALAAAILVGLFTPFINYAAIQQAIESQILRLDNAANITLLTGASKVICLIVAPTAASTLTHRAHSHSRRL